jgi:predicted esterase
MIQVIRFLAAVSTFAALAGQAIGGPDAIGRVESFTFPTRSLPPPFQVPTRFAEGYKLFQAGGNLLPEETIVKSVVVMGTPQIGLAAKEAKGLYANLDHVYDSISSDALFKGINSALPYCLSDKRASHGHYFAYYPATVTDDTQVIVFLHGYGGNFLFYAYLLKEEFPHAIVLVPSWSASWQDGTMQYLDDMYKDVKRKRSLAIPRPCLMAISAGGPAGFRLYNEHPDRFSCLVSLASAPPLKAVPELNDKLKILMVNGKQDSGFRIAHVQLLASKLSQRLPHFEFHVVDADHFFLLSKREETFRVVKAYLAKEVSGRTKSEPQGPPPAGSTSGPRVE